MYLKGNLLFEPVAEVYYTELLESNSFVLLTDLTFHKSTSLYTLLLSKSNGVV